MLLAARHHTPKTQKIIVDLPWTVFARRTPVERAESYDYVPEPAIGHRSKYCPPESGPCAPNRSLSSARKVRPTIQEHR
jgi:hypothetical protein